MMMIRWTEIFHMKTQRTRTSILFLGNLKKKKSKTENAPIKDEVQKRQMQMKAA